MRPWKSAPRGWEPMRRAPRSAKPLSTSPGGPNSVHVQLVPLFRIVYTPCPSLTVLWHLPTLRPPQTSLGELLLGRKLPPLPQPTLPPLPWGRVGWRRRARLQMRLGVQWATDSLLAALLPPNSSQNQEFSAFIDLLTDHLRVCLVPGPMSGTWGC